MCYSAGMRFLYIILFVSSALLLTSQELNDRKVTFNNRVYDPFFSASIKDNEGEKFNISKLSFYDEFNEQKFFFWVRRNSGLYSLSFKNIKKITFSPGDFADSRYKNYTRCTLELVTGESHRLYLKTTGHLEGWDEKFGSPVSFYLHYNLIESIEFNHEGEYFICPFCETIYFDGNIKSCIYDKTPLIKGVLSTTDK